jgi:gliding motility-associated-like protein
MMRIKYFSFVFAVLFLTAGLVSGQNFQLLYQPFEFPNGVDTNATGVGSSTGVNRWTINSAYDGLGIYPVTVGQDTTYSGQITGAPYSKYLHIFDSGNGASQGIYNSSYDPTVQSDRFVIINTDGVCTMGFDTVYFSFFYTCQGDTNNDYAQVYYSRNSGPWTLASQEHYSNKSKWKYELITNPGFLNASDLRFAFRWVNTASASPVTTAMAIDEVFVVGHYDSLTPPDTITAVSLNDTVCAGTNFLASFTFSDTLCDGFYNVELSDFTGNFSTPTTLFNNVGLFYPQTNFLFLLNIPTSTFPGNCYRIRLTRVSPPYPPIVIVASGCFTVIQCPNTVTTLQPVVTMDTNAVCAGSVIDVPFWSTGVFDAGNTYIAQLSDINGNFPTWPALGTVLGTFPSINTYDPNIVPSPGNVSGLIPDTVSAGCNYFVRVIATNPFVPPAPTLGSVWGPFCIQHCDAITNNEQDIHMCVNPPQDTCILIPVNINFYDSTQTYAAGNQFSCQLISRGPIPPPMTEVGLPGALGSIIAINDTLLQLCLHLDSLAFWGIPAGSYYLRIVANGASNSENSLGSLIRFSFGYPAATAPSVSRYLWPSLIPVGNKICLGDYILFVLNSPYNNSSTYNWQINNTVYAYPPNSFLVWVNGVQNFTVRVRENSVGCLGPLSPAMSFTVVGPPNVAISGPATICIGDTVKYQSVHEDSTFYLWNVTPGGTITDTANNVAWFTFDSAGTYTLALYGLNRCFDTTRYKTIVVKAPPVASASGDTTICTGSPVTLSTATSAGWTYKWTVGATQIAISDTLTVSPTTTTTYVVSVTNPVLLPPPPSVHQSPNCVRTDTVTITVDQPIQSSFQDSICIAGGTLVLDPGINPATYLWFDNSTSQQYTATDTGTYGVSIRVPGEVCNRLYSYSVGYAYPDSSEQNAFICAGEPLVIDATEPGATSYQWNTGQTSAQIPIDTQGTYVVMINTSTRECPITKIYHAIDVPDSCDRDFKLPNVFTPGSTLGYNDDFEAVTFGTYRTFNIKIFNRWGELIFESDDQHFKWNGNNKKGKPCPAGVYYYVGSIVHPEDTRSLHGFVTLIRDKK